MEAIGIEDSTQTTQVILLLDSMAGSGVPVPPVLVTIPGRSLMHLFVSYDGGTWPAAVRGETMALFNAEKA
ncbi:hypothetical protein EYZ11_013454 [Aspergillus tanneri]|uniref:Uncharacterized protein n=1 Tax=Aspergillus tanneri TaxID=1220188 RepID=A0A4S3IXM0_9EURO|nr:hypothetical protein EYZ11_013454 [Aspergillus tanneri]